MDSDRRILRYDYFRHPLNQAHKRLAANVWRASNLSGLDSPLFYSVGGRAASAANSSKPFSGEDNYGFHVPVNIRTHHEISDIINNNPFGPADPQRDGSKVLVTFLFS